MTYSSVKITIFHYMEFVCMRFTRLYYRTASNFCMSFSNILEKLILSI